MSEEIEKVISNILGELNNDLTQPISTKTLDDVTFHDFTKYEFLLDPSDYTIPPLVGLSKRAIEYVNDLENSDSSEVILEYMANFLVRLEENILRGVRSGFPLPIPKKN